MEVLGCEVAVVEIQPKGDASFHTCPSRPTSNESMIFSISHRGHMMCGRPTSATSIANWIDWGGPNVCECAAAISHPVLLWEQRGNNAF